MNYYAITIGPMDKTFDYAKKTREIWSASFSFSFLMKCLVEECQKYGDILLPNLEGKNDDTFEGIGVFPDRLIMLYEDSPLFDGEIIKSKALETFCEQTKFPLEDAKIYFQLFDIKISESELDNIELSEIENNESNIHKLNHLLNCKELQKLYNPKSLRILPKLFRWKTLQENYDLSFGEKKYRFNSLKTIAANDLITDLTIKEILNKEEENYSEKETEIIKNIPFKKYHNYIAILHGDGDNFGKVISSLKNDTVAIKTFSKKLIEFSLLAAKNIKDYGGSAIYIGGDDIMCFAPVKSHEKSIFNLIDDINNSFRSIFLDGEYNKIKVSISYGLSITYNKYPLNEALKKSHELMVKEAKNKLINPDKNGLALEILLHSGQQRKILLNLNKDENFDQFLKMVNSYKENEEIIQSLTHIFIEDEKMLIAICQAENYEIRLREYFNYHFNIKNNNNNEFAIALFNFLIASLKKNEKKIKDESYILQAINIANTACRLINFLNLKHD